MMKLMKFALAAAVAPLAIAASTAGAQTVAVADLQAAMANTKAAQAALQQIRTANASAISQIQARRQAAQTELQPLVTKYQADQRANAAPATLQAEASNIQQRENTINAEIARLGGPLELAQTYVLEQIQTRLQQAVQAVMAQRNATILLKPDATFVTLPAGDVTSAITAQLDTLVPSVNATPPAGYQPGQNAGASPAAATPPATGTRRNSSGR